jgi:hypothetical protein
MMIGPSPSRIAALALLLIVACDDDITGPRTERITLDICDNRWIAYQNDGAEWRLLGQGNGVYTFAATRRLGIARAFFSQNSSIWEITVDYLTPEQAVAKFGCIQYASWVGSLRGTIAGLTGSQQAFIYFRGANTHIPSPAHTSWSLLTQGGPGTLVAARHDSGFAPANRIIIRRERSYDTDTPVPLLDFDSNEAFAPQVNRLSFTGASGSAFVTYVTGGQEHGLSYVVLGSPDEGVKPRTAAAVYSIPAAQRRIADIHRMDLTSGGQMVQHYFRDGSDLSLTPGPPLATETFTVVATTSYRRVRAEVPSQPEYAAAISIEMSQISSGRWSQATLNATREYFGETPRVWSLTLPDFSGITGFQLANALTAGELRVKVTATNRRFGLSNANAQDEETVLSASRVTTIP